jgi:putative ABC transport system permease protein
LKQLLTESTLLAVVGGGMGVIAAVVGVESLVGVLPPDTPRLSHVSVSPAVLGFTTSLTLLTGVLAGIVPALNAFRTSLSAGVGASDRGGTSASRRRLRSALVIGEVTMAVVLLVGAGVLVKSFWQTMQVDPGFEAKGMIHFRMIPGADNWESAEELEQYYAGLREELRALPGITAVSTIHAVPVLNTGWRSRIYTVGNEPAADERTTMANWRPITPEYFSTAGMTLVAGRPFDDGDVFESESVGIINQTAARTLFGEDDPIGQNIVFRMEGSAPIRVVGIVTDVRIGGLEQQAPLVTYRPYRQAGRALLNFGQQSRSMVVRSDLPTSQIVQQVRAVVRDVDPMANVVRFESMEDTLSESLAERRGVMVLLVLFAATALLLGAVGIYGVMGYTVGERSRELSIRFALGASRSGVLTEVLLGGLKLTVIGLLVGGGMAAWLTRYLSSQLNGVSPTDPIAFGMAGSLLIVVALVAAYVPARRAAACDPIDAMRAE